jgi:hypothetical protein
LIFNLSAAGGQTPTSHLTIRRRDRLGGILHEAYRILEAEMLISVRPHLSVPPPDPSPLEDLVAGQFRARSLWAPHQRVARTRRLSEMIVSATSRGESSGRWW